MHEFQVFNQRRLKHRVAMLAIICVHMIALIVDAAIETKILQS